MNNSYNHSFLADNKSQKTTQHIAFEKRPSENIYEQKPSKNLTQNPAQEPILKQPLLLDTL